MDCPVCGTAGAEDITVQTFDGKTFRCRTCGEYDVAGSVIDPGALERLSADARRGALQKAKGKAQPGKRPMITSYDL